VSTDAESSNRGSPDEGRAGAGGFELPLPGEAREDRRLRRGLFGIRAADARAEIDARDAEISELRRDLAALWLAFGQHERTIRELLGAFERSSGVSIDPPGGRTVPAGTPGSIPPAPKPQPPPDPVGEQLSSLDQVLAAIAQATDSLEQTYREHVSESGEAEGTGSEPRSDED
jgi:hypothetical protein